VPNIYKKHLFNTAYIKRFDKDFNKNQLEMKTDKWFKWLRKYLNGFFVISLLYGMVGVPTYWLHEVDRITKMGQNC